MSNCCFLSWKPTDFFQIYYDQVCLIRNFFYLIHGRIRECWWDKLNEVQYILNYMPLLTQNFTRHTQKDNSSFFLNILFVTVSLCSRSWCFALRELVKLSKIDVGLAKVWTNILPKNLFFLMRCSKNLASVRFCVCMKLVYNSNVYKRKLSAISTQLKFCIS